jgi:uncharacterized membrane protein
MGLVFFAGQAGCLLPILILLNLFFGWLFFKPLTWLMVEVGLILLFILSSFFFIRKVANFSRRDNQVIDVEAKVEKD